MSSCLQIAPDESQITISAVSGKPILFKGDMVRAILDGRKTQTRRVVKLPSDAEHVEYSGVPNPGITYWTTDCSHYDPCPFGKPGDRLWVRETYNWSADDELLLGENHKKCPERGGCHADNVVWAADGVRERPKWGKALWRPSIHMPRWASRITLEITDVRVQRLQDISDEDAGAGTPVIGLRGPLEAPGLMLHGAVDLWFCEIQGLIDALECIADCMNRPGCPDDPFRCAHARVCPHACFSRECAQAHRSRTTFLGESHGHFA